jgi:hypothetical protein
MAEIESGSAPWPKRFHQLRYADDPVCLFIAKQDIPIVGEIPDGHGLSRIDQTNR